MKLYVKYVVLLIFLLAMVGYILPALISAKSTLSVFFGILLIWAAPVAFWKWVKR